MPAPSIRQAVRRRTGASAEQSSIPDERELYERIQLELKDLLEAATENQQGDARHRHRQERAEVTHLSRNRKESGETALLRSRLRPLAFLLMLCEHEQ